MKYVELPKIDILQIFGLLVRERAKITAITAIYRKGVENLTNLFRECRERVSAQDAARRYGLTFDRKGWALCPFHSDKHPSMSFRDGRFRCWACNVSGDSIDFTGRLLGLEPMEAVERLNADFCLSLPLHRKPTPAQAQAARRRLEIARAHKEFEDWRKTFISKLCAAYRVAHIALRDMEDWDKLTERETLAIRMQAQFEYWADTLADGTPKEQAQIYKERGRIAQWIEKVLSS